MWAAPCRESRSPALTLEAIANPETVTIASAIIPFRGVVLIFVFIGCFSFWWDSTAHQPNEFIFRRRNIFLSQNLLANAPTFPPGISEGFELQSNLANFLKEFGGGMPLRAFYPRELHNRSMNQSRFEHQFDERGSSRSLTRFPQDDRMKDLSLSPVVVGD